MKPEDIVKSHILQMEDSMKMLVEKNANELKDDVLGFLFAKSKRIRPIFTFLCTKALFENINQDIINLAVALELLHSATLLHDDVLDESTVRRQNESFYSKFGSKRAIVLGDYLLSLCLCALSKIGNPKVLTVFSKNIIKTVNGEINQFNNRFEFQNKEDYIKKSTLKTATIFACAAESVCILKDAPDTLAQMLIRFALDFGTVFQLKNDEYNFKNGTDDIKNGIYTLSSIYFRRDNPDCDIINIKEEDILKYAQKSDSEIKKIQQNSVKLLCANFEPTAKEALTDLFLNL